MIPEGFHGLFGLDLIRMGMRIFQRTVFQKELYGCFFSDARQPRDIIRAVPHESFQFNDLIRTQLVFLHDFLRMIVRDLRLSLFRGRNADRHAV